MTRLVLGWAMLMLLLLVEWAGTLAHAGWLAWFVAPLMAATVALLFMHAAQGSALSRIFAITGLFWVAILLSLGSVDFLARTDYPAPTRTLP